jgi:hypothetical protein
MNYTLASCNRLRSPPESTPTFFYEGDNSACDTLLTLVLQP